MVESSRAPLKESDIQNRERKKESRVKEDTSTGNENSENIDNADKVQSPKPSEKKSPKPLEKTELVKELNEGDVDSNCEVEEGILVVWDGSPSVPVFKRSSVKPGRFYIVNCGDSKNLGQFKGSSSCDFLNSAISSSGGNQLTSSSCGCCSSACQSYGLGCTASATNLGSLITGETGKRICRKRAKGPKKVQLVTKEEHHKILSSYIEDKRSRQGDAMKENSDANLSWLLDFKVDSLFPHQVDPGSESSNASTSLVLPPLTDNGGSRRTTRFQQKRMAPRKNCMTSTTTSNTTKPRPPHQNCVSSQLRLSQPCEIETVICDSLTAVVGDDAVVSFTVNRNPEIVDDVAGYEMVESQVTTCDIVEQSMEDSGISVSDCGMTLGQEDGDISMDGSSIDSCGREKRSFHMRKACDKESHGNIVCDTAGKPRCTYTDLIEKALRQSNGGLTVSEIYNWISSNYPYFQANDDRWKNSVRHNLSINPYFKKGDKARNGAGHLWVISEEGKGIRPPIRRKSGSDGIVDAVCIDNNIIPIRNETDRAISAILSEYAVASMQHQSQQHGHHRNHHHHQRQDNEAVTYIELPDDVTIGTANGEQGQVLCYEELPQPSYTIDVHENGANGDQMYTLSEFNPEELIIVNQNEANKENMTGEMLEDMLVSDFSVLHQDNSIMTTSNGRMSAPPQDTAITAYNNAKRDRVLNRSSSLPTSQTHMESELSSENQPGHSQMSGQDCTSELTMLTNMTSMANGSSEPMETMTGMMSAPIHQQETQVIEIIGGDHLFDAKELGMAYEYDNHGDPIFL